MEIKVNFKGKRIDVSVKKVGAFGKISGLMFKPRETENLLFDFGKLGRWNIHSFFVFFPFLAIWTDENNNVLETRVIEPFTFSIKPKKPFNKLIEIPLNEKNTKIIEFFVGKRKDLYR